MSETKHTPGPWKVREGDWSAEGYCRYEILPLTNLRIADARLIAAAPELLEALKALLADIEDYQTINHLGGENNASQVRARAAIAKAEGRQ